MKKIIYLLKLNLEKIPKTAWLFVSKRIIYPKQDLTFGSISQLLKANLLNRESFWWSPKKLRKILIFYDIIRGPTWVRNQSKCFNKELQNRFILESPYRSQHPQGSSGVRELEHCLKVLFLFVIADICNGYP